MSCPSIRCEDYLELVSKDEMIQHLKFSCKDLRLQCPDCSQTIIRAEAEDHFLHSCGRCIKCGNRGKLHHDCVETLSRVVKEQGTKIEQLKGIIV
jgi:hypothetical protein